MSSTFLLFYESNIVITFGGFKAAYMHSHFIKKFVSLYVRNFSNQKFFKGIQNSQNTYIILGATILEDFVYNRRDGGLV